MTKKKLLIAIPIILVALAGAWKFGMAKPKPAEAKPKVEGTVYVLGKEFLVNLADGHFGKLTVGLVLSPKDHSTAPAEGGHGAAPAAPPEGFGPMHQEAVVRDVITDALTGLPQEDLVDGEAREALKKQVARDIKKRTDVHVEDVLFTDVTVQ